MQMQVYKKVIVLLDFNNFFALYNWCKLLSKSGDAYHACLLYTSDAADE